MSHPSSEAARVIIEVMRVGSKRDGDGDEWKKKSISYHAIKGARHLLSYLIDSDPEHIRNATTRCGFILCILAIDKSPKA